MDVSGGIWQFQPYPQSLREDLPGGGELRPEPEGYLLQEEDQGEEELREPGVRGDLGVLCAALQS